MVKYKGPYHKYLGRFLRAGYRMAEANSGAKELADAKKQEEKQKIIDELNSDLEKYGLEHRKK